MRKFSTRRDEKGYMRLQLNNKDIFHFGPLDQGWWPDGLYTAPTDEALCYDIEKTKELGFNMIRKHLKVEPARWYAHCDRLGMMVWQDMPNGDKNQDWQYKQFYYGPEMVRTSESEAVYRKEWKEVMDCLYSYPCIGVWTPFNEAMGQFKSVEIADWTKKYDPTRPVNPASGGNYFPCGDILDLHSYPEPVMFLFDADRVNVIGEFRRNRHGAERTSVERRPQLGIRRPERQRRSNGRVPEVCQPPQGTVCIGTMRCRIYPNNRCRIGNQRTDDLRPQSSENERGCITESQQ